jgi:hypothetical protein
MCSLYKCVLSTQVNYIIIRNAAGSNPSSVATAHATAHKNDTKLLASASSNSSLRFAEVLKETYLYGKRDLLIWQKRPISLRIPQVC